MGMHMFCTFKVNGFDYSAACSFDSKEEFLKKMAYLYDDMLTRNGKFFKDYDRLEMIISDKEAKPCSCP